MAVCYKPWLTSKGVTQINDFNHVTRGSKESGVYIDSGPEISICYGSPDANGSSLQSVRASGLMSERNIWLSLRLEFSPVVE